MIDVPTAQQLEVGVRYSLVAEVFDFGVEHTGLERIIIYHPEDLNENEAAQYCDRHNNRSHFFLIDLELGVYDGV